MPRRDRYAEEMERVRAIVGRHVLPDFVTGFEVLLGDVDGDPAMRIVFRTSGDLPHDSTEPQRWLADVQGLEAEIKRDVFQSDEERYPYFRYSLAESAGPDHA